jgi:hypothetical protein
MYWRFFQVIGGPIWDSLASIRAQRIATEKAVKKFMKQIGADNCYGTSADNYAFTFPADKRREISKDAAWSKHPRISGAFYPAKRAKEAAELRSQLKELPELPSIHGCIREAGLMEGFPAIIEGGFGKSSSVRYYDVDRQLLIIQVPWRDVPEWELNKYKREHEAGTHSSAFYDHMLWKPHDSMEEIKEWQALKLISGD